MQITYDSKVDLLYIRLDPRIQPLVNERAVEDVVLDVGEDGKIVGIEVLNASRRVNLGEILPVTRS